MHGPKLGACGSRWIQGPKRAVMKPDRSTRTALSPVALIWRRFARPFRRNERGAVAIEFGLLAVPFFAIIGAIMETAFFFMASQILDGSVDHSVRLLRTGQVQTQSYTASMFRTSICDGLMGMFDCDQLKIDVQTVSDFASADFSYPLEPDTNNAGQTVWKAKYESFIPGNGGDIVTVRVYYKWHTLLDFLGFNLSNAGTGYRLMASVRVFENEPFGGSSSTTTSN